MKNEIKDALSVTIREGIEKSKGMFAEIALKMYEEKFGEINTKADDIKKLSTAKLTQRLEREIRLSELVNDYTDELKWYLTEKWYYVLTNTDEFRYVGISKDGKDFYFFDLETLPYLDMTDIKDELFDMLFIERTKRRAHRIESRGCIEYMADISGYEDISWVERGFPMIDFKTNEEKLYLNNIGELDWFKTRDWYYSYDQDGNLVISNDLYNFSIISGQTIDRDLVKDERLFQLFNGLNVDARSIHTLQIPDVDAQIRSSAIDDVTGYVDKAWSTDENQVDFANGEVKTEELSQRKSDEIIDGVTYPENGDIGYKMVGENQYELHSKTQDYIVEIEVEVDSEDREMFSPTQEYLKEIYQSETEDETFIEDDIDLLVTEFNRLGLDGLLEDIKAQNLVDIPKHKEATTDYGYDPKKIIQVKVINKIKSFHRPITARNSKYGHKKPFSLI